MSTPESPTPTDALSEDTQGYSKRKWALSVVLFTVLLWVAAWWLQNFTPRQPWLREVLRAEAFHILAHLILYATLYGLLRLALGPRRHATAIAVIATLSIAGVQELVQCATYRRIPGAGELFDLAVDTVALGVAHAVMRWRGIIPAK
ncbi:MAG: hypothetical protein Q8Q09_01235 [Deltaproteobacteria bacterium]|nr:hypothetical protein [Deltaproteobacteria bacterium]